MSKMFPITFIACLLTLCSPAASRAISAPASNSAPAPLMLAHQEINIPGEEAALAEKNGLKIIDYVSDPAVIQQMVDAGLAETRDGKLPLSITTYLSLDTASEPAEN